MTFTDIVQRQFFHSASSSDSLIRIPPTVIMSHNLPVGTPRAPFIKTRRRLNIWTVEEHERFLIGLERFPQGPWKSVAAVVGTKTTRQTMTHAQKYRQKIQRFKAGNSIKIHNMPVEDRIPEHLSPAVAPSVGFFALQASSWMSVPPSVDESIMVDYDPSKAMEDGEFLSMLLDLGFCTNSDHQITF